jgi:hypothetical protein
MALEGGNNETAKLLIEKGAKIDAVDDVCISLSE